jgi:serine/threonine protein kinase
VGKIALPSSGHWVEMLRAADEELAERPNAALLPIADAIGKLGKRRDWPHVGRLADAAQEHGLISSERAAATKKQGALGFFRFLSDYRNKLAHGSLRAAAFYDELAPLWLRALEEALACSALWGDAWLAVRATGDAPSRWLRLAGRAGIAVEPPNRERAERALSAGEVGLIAPGAVIRLHPIVVFRTDDLENEQVGILHRVERAPARADSDPSIGPLTYIDYASGSVFAESSAREAAARVLSTVWGRDVRVDELESSLGSSGAPSANREEVGRALGGYRLDKKLGGGLSEVVYLATQQSTGRRVALKVLRASGVTDPAAEARFKRGLVALAKCDHDRVVRVLAAELGQEPFHYAMEYVHGADLGLVGQFLNAWRPRESLHAEHLAKAVAAAMEQEAPGHDPNAVGDKPPSVSFQRRIAALFSPAVDGIAHLHDLEIVHRDIKPSNFVLTADGERLVLIDFGIARTVDTSVALTQVETDPVGTLRYMAPECLAGDATVVDRRADVYALGATLYEVVTGRPLFEVQSLPELRARHMSEAGVSARDLHGFDPGFALIVERCVARDRNRRYPNARELAEDLAASAEGRPLPHTRPQGVLARTRDTVRRHRGALAGGAALALIAAVLASYRWHRTRIVVEECAEVVERNAVPECVEGAPSSGGGGQYRLERQAGRVIRMRRDGKPETNSALEARPAIELARWEYEYADDLVTRAQGLDARGSPVLTLRFTPRNEAAGRVVDVAYLKDGVPWLEDSGDVSGRRLTFDPGGFVHEVRFLNRYGSNVRDRRGAFGYRYERDELGRVSATSPLAEPVDLTASQ